MADTHHPPDADATRSTPGDSMLTVVVALAANALIAAAKTVAAVLTQSASMVAEAAHSWADTGNEVFLLIAERRSARPADRAHPFGYGRAAYVWSLIAAFGLFVAGSILSVMHGISELAEDDRGSDYLVAYVVLAVAFVLEGISFRQAVRQTREGAARAGLGPLRYVLDTSQTTLRSVFFEDLAALLGILLATGGLVLHEVTGDAVYDAIGSILVGVLLGVVAVVLIWRNMQFLVGQEVSPPIRRRVLAALLEEADVESVTFLHLEYVGPSKVLLIAAVDLVDDEAESLLQVKIQAIEDRIEAHDGVARAIISLAAPGATALQPPPTPRTHP